MFQVGGTRLLSRIAAAVVVASLLLSGCAGPSGGGKKEWTVGFLNPTAQNLSLSALQKAIELQARKLGGRAIALDSKLDANKQLSDMEQLIAQKVDAIIVFPLDAKALGPALEKAQKAGIHLLAVDYTADEGLDQGPIVTQLIQGRRKLAEEQAAYLNQRLPNGGKVVYIDIAFPVPTLKFLRDRFKEELKKYPRLQLVEVVENPSDDAAGARPLIDQVLVKHRDLAAVVAYNDPSALGAYAAITSAGIDKSKIVITGVNAGVDGVQAVKDGKIDATWDINPVKLGINAVEAAYNLVSGKVKPSAAPKAIVHRMTRYTKENIGTIVLWDDQLKQLEASIGK